MVLLISLERQVQEVFFFFTACVGICAKRQTHICPRRLHRQTQAKLLHSMHQCMSCCQPAHMLTHHFFCVHKKRHFLVTHTPVPTQAPLANPSPAPSQHASAHALTHPFCVHQKQHFKHKHSPAGSMGRPRPCFFTQLLLQQPTLMHTLMPTHSCPHSCPHSCTHPLPNTKKESYVSLPFTTHTHTCAHAGSIGKPKPSFFTACVSA